MTEITRGRDKLLVSSDVAGPIDDQTTDLIANVQPRVAIIDGYPTFLHSNPNSDLQLLISMFNLTHLLLIPAIEILILDHHSARDYRYPALFRPIYRLAERLKKKFGTAAEILGHRSAVLTALEDYGTTRWHRWQPLDAPAISALVQEAIASGKIKTRWLASRLRTEPTALSEAIQRLYA
jgi:predicted metallo-beta-lactamase superfamily hydrolase